MRSSVRCVSRKSAFSRRGGLPKAVIVGKKAFGSVNWAMQPQTKNNSVCEQRRERHQYPIHQEVRYQCLRGSRISDVGAGETLEISSGKVQFTTQHDLKPGQAMRLAVRWPAKLNNTCDMLLEIWGGIVQSESGKATVKIERYKFRTYSAH